MSFVIQWLKKACTPPQTFVLALVLGLAVALASCGPTTKAHLAKFDVACLSAVQTIAHVEQNLSTFGKITPAQALQIRYALRPVIDAGIEGTEALMLWQPGQSTPVSVLRLAAALTDLIDVVVQALPAGDAQARLLQAIAYAQSAWAAVMQVLAAGDVPTPDLIGGVVCQPV